MIKSTSIFAGVLALAIVIAPLTAQACGDKDGNTSESDLSQETETSFTVENNSFSS